MGLHSVACTVGVAQCSLFAQHTVQAAGVAQCCWVLHMVSLVALRSRWWAGLFTVAGVVQCSWGCSVELGLSSGAGVEQCS